MIESSVSVTDAVVADPRLPLELRKNTAVIADDHPVEFFAVLEGKKQSLLLEQSQHEVQVRFLILSTVADRLKRFA